MIRKLFAALLVWLIVAAPAFAQQTSVQTGQDPSGAARTVYVYNPNTKVWVPIGSFDGSNTWTTTAGAASYTAPFTGAVSISQQIKNGDVLSVKSFGALGNSTGATGNGNDDTSAIQAALTNANGATIHFPCGIYRTTAPLTGNSGGVYRLAGNGACSKIFNDAASSVDTLLFNPGSLCSSPNIPCVVIDGLNFVPPTHGAAGHNAIVAANEQGFTLKNSIISGGRTGLSLATSYGPIITDNTFVNIAAAAIFSSDASFNEGQIEGNKFYGNGAATNDAAITINSANGGLRILNNDLEGNYAGLILNGAHSGDDIERNYFELQTSYDFYVGGTAKGLDFRGNRIGSGLSVVWIGVQQSEFARNVFGGAAGTVTAPAANDVHDNIVESGNALVTNASIPTSCGTSPLITNQSTDVSGQITTGSSATTTCHIAFAGTYAAIPICTANIIGTPQSAFQFVPSAAGITFTYGSGTALTITYRCLFST